VTGAGALSLELADCRWMLCVLMKWQSSGVHDGRTEFTWRTAAHSSRRRDETTRTPAEHQTAACTASDGEKQRCRSAIVHCLILFNPLEFRGNYSAISNNMKLVYWPLMGGPLHLVQRGWNWAGPQPTQASPHYTKCNSPPISGQCTNHHITLLCSSTMPIKGLNKDQHLVIRSF